MSAFKGDKDFAIDIKPFDGSNILFVVTPEGEQLIPVKTLANHFGIELKTANQIIGRKRDLFVDKVVKLNTERISSPGHNLLPDSRMKSFDCFTIAGALQWVNLLSHTMYSGERRETIVKMKNWLVDLGASVIQGKPLGQIERGEVRVISTELTNRIKELLKEKIVDRYEDGRNHDHIYSNEFRMLNKATIGEHKKGMKETLNASGLQVHNTGQIADIALLNADVLNYEKRKESITLTTGMVYGSINKASLRLTEQERARLTRNCSRTQKGLSEYTGGC